ncbi:hypothetical protein D3C72_2224570 [compost metagenome]
MHIQTESTAVELGNADVDQVLERGIDGRFADRHAQVGQRFSKCGSGFVVIDASAHGLSSFLCGMCHAMEQIYAVNGIVKRYKIHKNR